MRSVTPDEIDALLPQTQCGLCGYGGCLPYAEAMAANLASIHLCPPGGVATLVKLGEKLDIDPRPYIAEIEAKTKPPVKAVIREPECIGCTKCIKACPVDAIIGTAKAMHVVLTDHCTGCELCIPACPVDCIDLLPIPYAESTQATPLTRDLARERYHNRQVRLQKASKVPLQANHSLTSKKRYIEAAIARVKAKRTK